ncbi:MAG: mechanosensitive ion channel family protein [Pseudanabaena sp.]|nr:MAG: mechanosensitive ion channel family protein [Pseudanabaena sp.]
MPSTAQPSLSPSTPPFTLGQTSPRIFSVGDIEFASVHLDGFALFQIASPHFSLSEAELNDNLSPIQRRVQRIEANLFHLINLGFDPKTLDVRPSILNNLTVIVASDRADLAQQVVLTVTEIDAQIDPSSVEELAQRWSQIIRTALIEAQQTRQPEARKRQFLSVTAIALGIFLLSVLLMRSQKFLKKRFHTFQKKLKEEIASVSDRPSKETTLNANLFPQPLDLLAAFRKQANLQQKLTLNIWLRRLEGIGLLSIWFGGITMILHIFPETRLGGRSLLLIPLRIFIIWLVLTFISLLVNFYVNYKLQEWVEEADLFSENYQRRLLRVPTLLDVSRGMISFSSWCLGIIWFLAWKGAFPSSLLTGAGLIGAALTFAFQNLLKDWINGLLIITEDQYAVGDMLEFQGFTGMVENMSLRATQIRLGTDGRLVTIPHNQIMVAHNLTKDWSRVNFMIEVAYDTDANTAIALMGEVARTMAVDPQWQEDILEPVTVIGVNQVSHAGIELMMRITVKRLRQWDVEREFRRRIKSTFDEQGIQIGIPKQTLSFSDPDLKEKFPMN